MTQVFRFEPGRTPLLVSVPHDGREILPDMIAHMTPAGLELPDTDWHVAELYEFAQDIGASMLIANYSRYVIDLNRSASNEVLYPGQLVTGLCPEKTFAGDRIYEIGEAVDDKEMSGRIERCWQPYHEHLAATLDKLKSTFGYALLWDAHSIPSRVPRLFDGELPILNIGTFDGCSAAPGIADPVIEIAKASDYETVANERFKGGYITRHYGSPASHVHALQLEIAQRAYMNENSRVIDPARASALRDTLRQMLQIYLEAGERLYS